MKLQIMFRDLCVVLVYYINSSRYDLSRVQPSSMKVGISASNTTRGMVVDTTEQAQLKYIRIL